MYRKNRRKEQVLLISDVNYLPERSLKNLKESWAATFREEVFLRIDEDKFSVLYSKKISRPNVPVNLLLGLEILKAGRNWTDEELYERFLYDLQIRYAVGCDNFGDENFSMRTLYYFRQRLVEHAIRTGQNLMMEIFEQITDQQMEKIGLRTEKQRLDSTQLMSNIADLSRLELLITAIQRLWRILTKEDQRQYEEIFHPYIKESSGQYTYRLKGREVVWSHIELVGQDLKKLLDGLAAHYSSEMVYTIVRRFFDENFQVIENETRAKNNNEITAGCLQSLDDLEATYRTKRNSNYKGYVANIAETCHPENPVQLIDQVQVAPNRVHDCQLFKEGVESLKARTGMAVVVTDGGYVSTEIDQKLRELDVDQITTGLTGTLPDHNENRLAFSDFEMKQDRYGDVTHVTCPRGHTADITKNPSGKSFRFTFDAYTCINCSEFKAGHCPVKTNSDLTAFNIFIPKDRANSSQRRRRFERNKQEARNLRTAVEASIFQLKHRWVNGKLRVRGQFRVTTVVICAALSVNLRRIDHYRKGKLRMKGALCNV